MRINQSLYPVYNPFQLNGEESESETMTRQKNLSEMAFLMELTLISEE